MIITNITKLPKIEGEMFIVLAQGSYCESTGWEKEGDIGSRREYAVVRMLTRTQLEEYVIDNPTDKIAVYRAEPVKIERKIDISVNIK